MSLKRKAAKEVNKRVGFPGNLKDDYAALNFMGNTKLNNIGDPFVQQDKWGNTLGFEVKHGPSHAVSSDLACILFG